MTRKLLLIVLAICLAVAVGMFKKNQERIDSLDSTIQSTEQQRDKLQTELNQLEQKNTGDERKIQELEQKIKQLEADLQAKREHQQWLASLPNHERWMFQAGIPQDQWGAAYTLVNRESRWRPDVVNPSSGACGLAQSLPCSKIAKAGLDWKNPVHALQWQYKYVTERYGDYNKALAFWSCIGTCSSKLGTTSKVTTWY